MAIKHHQAGLPTDVFSSSSECGDKNVVKRKLGLSNSFCFTYIRCRFLTANGRSFSDLTDSHVRSTRKRMCIFTISKPSRLNIQLLLCFTTLRCDVLFSCYLYLLTLCLETSRCRLPCEHSRKGDDASRREIRHVQIHHAQRHARTSMLSIAALRVLEYLK